MGGSVPETEKSAIAGLNTVIASEARQSNNQTQDALFKRILKG